MTGGAPHITVGERRSSLRPDQLDALKLPIRERAGTKRELDAAVTGGAHTGESRRREPGQRAQALARGPRGLVVSL